MKYRVPGAPQEIRKRRQRTLATRLKTLSQWLSSISCSNWRRVYFSWFRRALWATSWSQRVSKDSTLTSVRTRRALVSQWRPRLEVHSRIWRTFWSKETCEGAWSAIKNMHVQMRNQVFRGIYLESYTVVTAYVRAASRNRSREHRSQISQITRVWLLAKWFVRYATWSTFSN